ncbi:MAG: anion permease [Chlamydiia bacterium]|nr:anion permease [Chlamydiia bacterium]
MNKQTSPSPPHSLKRLLHKKVIPFLIVILIGFVIWIIPHPDEVSAEAWQLLAIFVATIVGVVVKPLPIGAIAIIAMSFATLTKTLTLENVLGGFSNNVVWLVLFAFFIARGFIRTGLGTRIAYIFVAILGKKTLGLSYGLVATEFILSPAIPSVTARAGGVVFPVLQSLARSFGSDPEHQTQKKIGAYLTKVIYQASVISSTMFLTAMAANPVVVTLTKQAGYSISWGKWALGALVPGLISLIFMPYFIYKIYPPQIKDTPDAPKIAKEHLSQMGPLKKEEWMMLGIFILLLILWIFGPFLSMHATVAAMIGVSLLLILGVIHWHDVIKDDKAWNTFIWFATLIMLASYLNNLGLVSWFSKQMVVAVGGMPWQGAFALLAFIYFYSHYFFASNLAHVGAMYPAFLMVALGVGTPPGLAIPVLAYSSSLFGGLTHYGSGPAPLFYGSGYVSVKSWWYVALMVSFLNIIVWFGFGSIWWKLLGFW